MAQSSVTIFDDSLVPQLEMVADTDMRGIAITYVRGDWFDPIRIQQIQEGFSTLSGYLSSENVIGWTE